jgi:hypothetical protein
MTDPIPPEAVTAAEAHVLHRIVLWTLAAHDTETGMAMRRQLIADILAAASPVLRAADAETIARKDRELDGLRRENEHIRNELAARETTP